MSNIRLVAIVMLNGVLLLMRAMIVCAVSDYLVPNTSPTLLWIDFLMYLALHTWVLFAFQQKLFLNWLDAIEELLRRMVRALRA
ncbi:MAG: hypothetical protein KGO50_07340 [Myxococcales bacterium]|nr:hypothetical protein [Myxococcales bacterium]